MKRYSIFMFRPLPKYDGEDEFSSNVDTKEEIAKLIEEHKGYDGNILDIKSSKSIFINGSGKEEIDIEKILKQVDE